MMKSNKLLAVNIIIAVIIVLESTLLRKFPGKYILPDVALLILIFFSSCRGIMPGQITGFVSGLIEDFLSLSPPGFNGFIKTVTGFIFGSFKGKVFIDPIFFPVVMAAAATGLKGLIAVIIAAVFIRPESAPAVITARFGYELLFNCIASPFVFALMKSFKLYTVEERGF